MIPKFHETFIPILTVLANGDLLPTGDLKLRVVEQFYKDLPQELLEQRTKSGYILIHNRIGWGKAYLKQAGMLEQPEYGKVRITPKGLEVLRRGTLTFKELRKDPEFIANRKIRNEESEQEHEESTPQDLIDSGIKSIEAQVKEDLLAQLKTTDPYHFEKVVLVLLEKMGYGIARLTPRSGDGGIDGEINMDKLGLDKIYVQAKRYAENKVRETEIRNFIGAMSRDASRGIFVTTSSFDEKAMQKAHDAGQKIILIDGEHLVDLMYTFGVGVQVRDTYEIKQLDEDFFQDSDI